MEMTERILTTCIQVSAACPKIPGVAVLVGQDSQDTAPRTGSVRHRNLRSRGLEAGSRSGRYWLLQQPPSLACGRPSSPPRLHTETLFLCLSPFLIAAPVYRLGPDLTYLFEDLVSKDSHILRYRGSTSTCDLYKVKIQLIIMQ